MKLTDIYSSSENAGYLSLKDGHWVVLKKKESSEVLRRRVMGFLFKEMSLFLQRKDNLKEAQASSKIRDLWNEEKREKPQKDLPSIIRKDLFLRMYAEAASIDVVFFKRLWKKMLESPHEGRSLPIYIGETLDSYFDVDATPPGFLPKFFSKQRIKKDPGLLEKIQKDFEKVALIEDKEKRNFLTIAILAHGVSYREVEGKILYIPSLTSTEPGLLIPYCFQQHLIWEGVKTVSVFPIIREEKERSFYLCQGTEIWPSQPSMLGSIFANLGKEGSATEPYAHSWRRIHKHLRYLTRPHLPIVAGHSMGGAFATQIALYSHALIEKAYIFNPVVTEKKEYDLYHRLPKEEQQKILVFASIDDLPFWRIGSKVIGQLTCFLGEKRWRYRPLKKWELLLILPALCKAIVNVVNALPAHQRIVALLRSYIYFSLSEREIEWENKERVLRFDHIDFFPKLYRPARYLLHYARKLFGWQLYNEYLKGQIELIELQEADLEETFAILGGEDIEKQLKELKKQKESLKEKLKETSL